MKIEVDRTIDSEKQLVFTIKVSEPHHACFGNAEKEMMNILDMCKQNIHLVSLEESKMKTEIINLIHHTKERTFERVLGNLKFAISNEMRPMFEPICQEIYNWIYDHQIDDLKKWMQEFDPQRTKFYFANDQTPQKNYCRQESEHDDEDEDDEDDINDN